MNNVYVTSRVKNSYATVLFDITVAVPTSSTNKYPSTFIEIELPTSYDLFVGTGLF